ncbi:MAG: phosphohistidine phosphatase SixA [Candidatus Kryptoniota bacterium]
MELYLLRHAIASEKGAGTFARDADRPLTTEGTQKMRHIAKAMKGLDLSFDLILSSPYLRAKQTAEIVADVFGLEKTLRFSGNLAVDGNIDMLIKEIRLESLQKILLVGHEPYLSTLISLLISGHDGIDIVMKKGGLCKLTIDSLRLGKCATLEWLIGPRQILHGE